MSGWCDIKLKNDVQYIYILLGMISFSFKHFAIAQTFPFHPTLIIIVKEHTGLIFCSRSFSFFALMLAYNRNIQLLYVRLGGQRHIDLKTLDRKPALCF